MKKYNSLLIIIFIIFTVQSYSQQIENVDFTIKENNVIVSYDLINCPKNMEYDLTLKIICDKNTFEPKSVTGDLENISSGKNKKIVWNVFNDRVDLKGNIQAIVEISRTHKTKNSIKITGGPSNALWSMILPGLGDYFVIDDKESIQPLGIAVSFFAPLILAWSSKVSSNESYKTYHSATEQTAMDEAYKKANDSYQVYQFMLGVAGSIWLGDVIYVTIKGFKNRREQLNRYSQNNTKVNLFFVSNSKGFQIGIVKKF